MRSRVPFAGLALAAVSIAIGYLSGSRADATEDIAWLGVLFFVATYPPLRTQYATLPRPHREIVAGLLACMLAGQLIDEDRVLFPFPSWTMYSSPILATERGARVVALEGETSAGVRFPIDVERLYGPLATRVLVGLRRRADDVARTGARADDPRAEERLAAWVRAIARTFNAGQPEDAQRIDVVSVYRGWLPFGTAPEAAAKSQELLARITLR